MAVHRLTKSYFSSQYINRVKVQQASAVGTPANCQPVPSRKGREKLAGAQTTPTKRTNSAEASGPKLRRAYGLSAMGRAMLQTGK